MTFPLPLTPFEEYMLRDGTPSHPMEFFFRLSFDGPLDPHVVATAATEALRRHPLLAARIEARPGSRPRFVPASVRRFVDDLAVNGPDDLPLIPALDVATGPLTRLHRITRPDGTTEVLAQFHHTCCDGLGAVAFLGDFCIILDATLRGTPPACDAADPRALRTRGRYGLDCWKLVRSLPAQARGLEGVWKFLRHRPVRLAIEGIADASTSGHHLQRCGVDFTEEEARSLRRAAHAAGVSLNELAAAALFEAMQDSMPDAVATASGRGRDVLRLSIPMNMRRPADRRMPAANVVSMVFLDRGPTEIAGSGLAASLHDEMQLIRRLGLGMTFLFTLAVARGLPGGIAGLVGDRSTAATALFTNLGRILSRTGNRRDRHVQVGSHRLVAVEVIAPLRRGTTLAVAAAEYGGTLTFTLRTDPRAIDAAATAMLRDAFARCLGRHLPDTADTRPSDEPTAVAEACA